MEAKLFAVLFVAIALTWEGVSGMYYGKKIGDFEELDHDVKGALYCADDTTVVLVNFHYDGKGPAAYFFIGKSDTQKPIEGAEKLFVSEDGQTDGVPLKSFTDDTIVLKLTKPIAEYNYFTIYCTTATKSFGIVKFPTDFKAPAAQPLDIFASATNGIGADSAELMDSITIELKGFKYDGTGVEARFAVGEEESTEADKLVKLVSPKEQDAKLEAHTGDDIKITLKDGTDWTQFKIFHVYDFGATPSASLGSIKIDETKASELIANPMPTTMIKPRQGPPPPQEKAAEYYGVLIGEFPAGGKVEGKVYAFSDTKICLEKFTYDGTVKDAMFMAGKADTLDDTAVQVPDETAMTKHLKGYKDSTFVVTLPEIISTYKSFGVYSKTMKALGQVKIDASNAPAPQKLDGDFKGAELESTGVTLEDSMKIMIEAFKYSGTPAADDDLGFAAVKMAGDPKDKLIRLKDEAGTSDAKITTMTDAAEVKLTLPKGSHWNMFTVFQAYNFKDPGAMVAEVPIPDAKAKLLPAGGDAPNDVHPFTTMGDKTTAKPGAKTTKAGNVTTAGTGGPGGKQGESTTAAPAEEGGIGLIVILGIVGIVVCIGVGIAFFFFFAPGGEEPSAGAAPAEGATGATGDGTAGTTGAK